MRFSLRLAFLFFMELIIFFIRNLGFIPGSAIVAIVYRVRFIMLTSLFSLLYVPGECHRCVHRG